MKHILLLAAFVFAACGTPSASPMAAPTGTPLTEASAPTATDVLATATPALKTEITLTDSAGRSVVVKLPVNRIVSLAPSTTEIVVALDGLDRLIAIDMYSDYPPEVSALPKITNPDMSVDYEQITASAPDVVFAAGITAPDVITAIEKLGISVIVVGSPNATFAAVLTDIRLVGAALERDTEAQVLTETMQTEWQALADRVAKTTDRPTVFWELDATDPSKPYTVGPDSFVAELLQVAGGTNIFADVTDAYPQVSLEQIVAKAPDTIILADSIWGVTPEAVAARAGWESIPAVQNQRVFPIDDNVVSRPGPRIVQGLQAVISILHPELK